MSNMDTISFKTEFCEKQRLYFESLLDAKVNAIDMLISEAEDFFIKNSSVKAVFIMGYTPVWNDGDVCRHRSFFTTFYEDGSVHDDNDFVEIELDSYHYYLDKGDISKAESFLDKSRNRCGERLIELALQSKLDLVPEGPMYETTYAEEAYGTNYIILLTRSDHGIDIEARDYIPEW